MAFDIAEYAKSDPKYKNMPLMDVAKDVFDSRQIGPLHGFKTAEEWLNDPRNAKNKAAVLSDMGGEAGRVASLRKNAPAYAEAVYGPEGSPLPAAEGPATYDRLGVKTNVDQAPSRGVLGDLAYTGAKAAGHIVDLPTNILHGANQLAKIAGVEVNPEYEQFIAKNRNAAAELAGEMAGGRSKESLTDDWRGAWTEGGASALGMAGKMALGLGMVDVAASAAGGAGDTYDKAKEAGYGQGGAAALGLGTGAITGTAMAIAQRLTMGTAGGVLGKGGTGSMALLQDSLRPLFNNGFKRAAMDAAKVGGEVTAMGLMDEFANTEMKRAAGLTKESGFDVIKHGWGERGVSALIFGIAGSAFHAAGRADMAKALETGHAPWQARVQAAKEVYNVLKKTGNHEAADYWSQSAAECIKNGESISMDGIGPKGTTNRPVRGDSASQMFPSSSTEDGHDLTRPGDSRPLAAYADRGPSGLPPIFGQNGGDPRGPLFEFEPFNPSEANEAFKQFADGKANDSPSSPMSTESAGTPAPARDLGGGRPTDPIDPADPMGDLRRRAQALQAQGEDQKARVAALNNPKPAEQQHAPGTVGEVYQRPTTTGDPEMDAILKERGIEIDEDIVHLVNGTGPYQEASDHHYRLSAEDQAREQAYTEAQSKVNRARTEAAGLDYDAGARPNDIPGYKFYVDPGLSEMLWKNKTDSDAAWAGYDGPDYRSRKGVVDWLEMTRADKAETERRAAEEAAKASVEGDVRQGGVVEGAAAGSRKTLTMDELRRRAQALTKGTPAAPESPADIIARYKGKGIHELTKADDEILARARAELRAQEMASTSEKMASTEKAKTPVEELRDRAQADDNAWRQEYEARNNWEIERAGIDNHPVVETVLGRLDGAKLKQDYPEGYKELFGLWGNKLFKKSPRKPKGMDAAEWERQKNQMGRSEGMGIDELAAELHGYDGDMLFNELLDMGRQSQRIGTKKPTISKEARAKFQAEHKARLAAAMAEENPGGVGSTSKKTPREALARVKDRGASLAIDMAEVQRLTAEQQARETQAAIARQASKAAKEGETSVPTPAGGEGPVKTPGGVSPEMASRLEMLRQAAAARSAKDAKPKPKPLDNKELEPQDISTFTNEDNMPMLKDGVLVEKGEKVSISAKEKSKIESDRANTEMALAERRAGDRLIELGYEDGTPSGPSEGMPDLVDRSSGRTNSEELARLTKELPLDDVGRKPDAENKPIPKGDAYGLAVTAQMSDKARNLFRKLVNKKRNGLEMTSWEKDTLADMYKKYRQSRDQKVAREEARKKANAKTDPAELTLGKAESLGIDEYVERAKADLGEFQHPEDKYDSVGQLSHNQKTVNRAVELMQKDLQQVNTFIEMHEKLASGSVRGAARAQWLDRLDRQPPLEELRAQAAEIEKKLDAPVIKSLRGVNEALDRWNEPQNDAYGDTKSKLVDHYEKKLAAAIEESKGLRPDSAAARAARSKISEITNKLQPLRDERRQLAQSFSAHLADVMMRSPKSQEVVGKILDGKPLVFDVAGKEVVRGDVAKWQKEAAAKAGGDFGDEAKFHEVFGKSVTQADKVARTVAGVFERLGLAIDVMPSGKVKITRADGRGDLYNRNLKATDTLARTGAIGDSTHATAGANKDLAIHSGIIAGLPAGFDIRYGNKQSFQSGFGDYFEANNSGRYMKDRAARRDAHGEFLNLSENENKITPELADTYKDNPNAERFSVNDPVTGEVIEGLRLKGKDDVVHTFTITEEADIRSLDDISQSLEHLDMPDEFTESELKPRRRSLSSAALEVGEVKPAVSPALARAMGDSLPDNVKVAERESLVKNNAATYPQATPIDVTELTNGRRVTVMGLDKDGRPTKEHHEQRSHAEQIADDLNIDSGTVDADGVHKPAMVLKFGQPEFMENGQKRYEHEYYVVRNEAGTARVFDRGYGVDSEKVKPLEGWGKNPSDPVDMLTVEARLEGLDAGDRYVIETPRTDAPSRLDATTSLSGAAGGEMKETQPVSPLEKYVGLGDGARDRQAMLDATGKTKLFESGEKAERIEGRDTSEEHFVITDKAFEEARNAKHDGHTISGAEFDRSPVGVEKQFHPEYGSVIDPKGDDFMAVRDPKTQRREALKTLAQLGAGDERFWRQAGTKAPDVEAHGRFLEAAMGEGVDPDIPLLTEETNQVRMSKLFSKDSAAFDSNHQDGSFAGGQVGREAAQPYPAGVQPITYDRALAEQTVQKIHDSLKATDGKQLNFITSDQAPAGTPQSRKAFVDGQGNVTIIMDRHADVADVVASMIHEARHGAESLIFPDPAKADRFFRDVASLFPAETAEAMRRGARNHAEAAREVFAEMAAKIGPDGLPVHRGIRVFVDRAVSILRAGLRALGDKFGLDLKYSEAEMRSMALKALALKGGVGNPGPGGPKGGVMEKLISHVADQLRPFQQYERKATVRDGNSFYDFAGVMPSRMKARVEKMIDEPTAAMGKTLAGGGFKGIEELQDYLTAHTLEERGHSGTVAAMEQRYTPAQLQTLEAAARTFYDVTNKALDYAVGCGRFSAAEAAKIKRFQKYARLGSDGEFKDNAGFRVDLTGHKLSRNGGTGQFSEDVIGHTMRQAYDLIRASEKNVALNRLARTVRDNPQLNELSVSKNAAPGSAKFYVNGEAWHVNPHTESLRTALHALDAETLPKFMKALQAYNRFKVKMDIGFNAGFMLSNLCGDTGFTAASLSSRPQIGNMKGTDMALAVFKGIPQAMKHLHGVFKGNITDPHVKEWAEGGGPMGLARVGNTEDMQSDLRTQVRLNQKGAAGSALRFVSQVGKGIEYLNNISENANRLSTYLEARKAGLSKDKALALSKDVTGNYDRKGNWGTIMSTLFLYSNAAVQSSKMIASMAKRNPQQFAKVTAGIAALGFAATLANRKIAGGDRDDNDYDRIPQDVKDRYAVLLTGGENSAHIKFKMPHFWGMWYNLGQSLADSAAGKSTSKSALNFMGRMVNNLNPIGGMEYGLDSMERIGHGFGQMVTPSALRPLYDVAVSRDEEGRHMKWNGSPLKPGKELGYLAQSVAGGVGTLVGQAAKTVMGTGDGPNDVPLANRLYGVAPWYMKGQPVEGLYRDASSEYLSLRKELDSVAKNPTALAAFKQEHAKVMPLIEFASSTDRQLRRYGAERKKAGEAGNTARAEAYAAEMYKLKRSFLKKYREVHDGVE